MKISICDSDYDCLRYIGQLLRQIIAAGGSTVTYYTSGDWLKSDIISHESAPDILIINKTLGDTDGIALAQMVLSYVPWCRVIILCDCNRIYPVCFSVEHSFILPKELLPMYLATALNKAISDLKEQNAGQVVVTSNRTHMILAVRQIIFFERLQRKTIIVMDQETINTYQTPADILNSLTDSPIIQCHKSYFVNTRRIRSYTRNQIVMDNNTKIPVGRAYYENAIHAITSLQTPAVLGETTQAT